MSEAECCASMGQRSKFGVAALLARPGLENSDILPKDNSVMAPGMSGPAAAILVKV
jgi:hypothetical protein